MIHTKKKFLNGDFVKKGSGGDIQDKDVVKILDAGQRVPGKEKTNPVTGESVQEMQDIFTIQTKNGPKLCSFNKGTMDGLADAYGEDTEGWVGKEIVVLYNELANRCYFAAPGWTPRRVTTKSGNQMIVFDPPASSPSSPAEEVMGEKLQSTKK